MRRSARHNKREERRDCFEDQGRAGSRGGSIHSLLGPGGLARAAEQWNFYMHQSAPNFATSRGAKLLTEEIDKATNGDLKVRLHLSGTLQINASNITQAVERAWSSSATTCSIPATSRWRHSAPADADPILRGFRQSRLGAQALYREAFGQKGSTVLSSYSYPMQVIWGRKKLESRSTTSKAWLRVAQPEQGEFVRRFGGTSITMSAPEVPSALDRGVVEIFTAGVGAVLWKDLLKYGYLLVVNVNNSYFIANTDAYRKLFQPAGALRKVAEDTARWNQDTMKKEETESQGTLAAAGYTLTNAKPAEIARAVDAVKPYWDEWAKTRGPDAVEA